MISCDTKDKSNERENIEAIEGSLLNDKHAKSRFEIYKENKIKKQKAVIDIKSDSYKRSLFEDIDRYSIHEIEDPKDNLIEFLAKERN